MKENIAKEVQRLMNRLDGLEKEKDEVTVKMLDDDMIQLKEKLGYRCVSISADQVRDAINKDIELTIRKLQNLVGEDVSVIESRLRTSILNLISDIFNKHLGGYQSLAYEVRILIAQMVDEEVDKIIKILR